MPSAGQQSHTVRRATPLRTLAREVLTIPTAPYVERHVIAYVRGFAAARGLDYARDAYGNAYVTYRRGRRRRPLVLGAHTDHPGFVITAIRGRRLELEFRGGLSAAYGKGERLRLYNAESGEQRGLARITSIRSSRRAPGAPRRIDGARATIERESEASQTDPAAGDLALWDVDAFRIQGELLHARQCDDLAGCVAVLATLDRLAASRQDAHVVGLFTRAEEVGLLGASVVGRKRLLPDDAIVIAVETSSMAGGRAEQGAGPIVRTGDAVHIFSPRVTQWMVALAQELQHERGGFPFQRKLMDGGTTEATSYDLYGYETGAACIALGNYHNAGPRNRVAAETVHLGDLDGLVRLFERMAQTAHRYERYLPQLLRRYDALAKTAAPRLRASADG